jgi:hypothetical protein
MEEFKFKFIKKTNIKNDLSLIFNYDLWHKNPESRLESPECG